MITMLKIFLDGLKNNVVKLLIRNSKMQAKEKCWYMQQPNDHSLLMNFKLIMWKTL